MNPRFGLFLLLAGGLHGAAFLLSRGTATSPEFDMARGRMSIALRPVAAPEIRREAPAVTPVRPDVPAAPREEPPPERETRELPEEESPAVEKTEETETVEKTEETEAPEEPAEPPPAATTTAPREPEEAPPGNAAPDDRGELEEPVPDPRNRKPDYPRLARRRGIEGAVELRLLVLPDGRVGEVEVSRSSGHRILDEAAIEAARGYRFTPARRNGRAVTAERTQRFEFRLRGRQ